MPRLNIARSRVRFSSCSFARIAQTWPGHNGGQSVIPPREQQYPSLALVSRHWALWRICLLSDRTLRTQRRGCSSSQATDQAHGSGHQALRQWEAWPSRQRTLWPIQPWPLLPQTHCSGPWRHTSSAERPRPHVRRGKVGAPSQDANSRAAPISKVTPWLRNCFRQLPKMNQSSVREARKGSASRASPPTWARLLPGQTLFQFSARQDATRTVKAAQMFMRFAEIGSEAEN